MFTYIDEKGTEYKFPNNFWIVDKGYAVNVNYEVPNPQVLGAHIQVTIPTLNLDLRKLMQMKHKERQEWIANRIHTELLERFREGNLHMINYNKGELCDALIVQHN